MGRPRVSREGVRSEFCRLHDDNDGGSVGLERVGLAALKDGSRTGRELNPRVEMGGDRDPARPCTPQLFLGVCTGFAVVVKT
jgi:hypothetical protein